MGFIIFFDPLEQFNLSIYYTSNFFTLFQFSNFTVMVAVVLLSLGGIINLLSFLSLTHWSILIVNGVFNFLANICKNNLNISVQIFFPFLTFTFMFILLSNIYGMIPYTFTITSHLSVTFFLALSFFIGANIFGILKHGIEFFNLFLPSSSPILISPLLMIVEFVSYIARVFSLSIRLFANMMAGHALMKILASFSFLFFKTGLPSLVLVGFIVAFIILVIIGLEFLIAFLQAYVFFMLMVVYLNDLVQIGH